MIERHEVAWPGLEIFAYDFGKYTTVSLTVDNVFDKEPPRSPGSRVRKATSRPQRPSAFPASLSVLVKRHSAVLCASV